MSTERKKKYDRFVNSKIYKKFFRCEQGSNLRGETPLDFKSNALTTRPSQQLRKSCFLWSYILLQAKTANKI